ncbi:MAG: hypothetical protein KDI05_10570 [Halieaceae bacterium]|nr:hypothetical protein [Halieaceae bacterium]
MSGARRRYYRTTLLSVLALGALLWVAVDQFGLRPGEIRELLFASLLALLVVVLAAAATVAVWVLLRKLFSRR